MADNRWSKRFTWTLQLKVMKILIRGDVAYSFHNFVFSVTFQIFTLIFISSKKWGGGLHYNLIYYILIFYWRQMSSARKNWRLVNWSRPSPWRPPCYVSGAIFFKLKVWTLISNRLLSYLFGQCLNTNNYTIERKLFF